jgi:hypothetical protein
MHRGSRIVLTVVTGGVLLLAGLVVLVIGAGLSLTGDFLDDCVVEEYADTPTPQCHDDELTEKVTAEVLEVQQVDDYDGDVPFAADYDVYVRFLAEDPTETDVYVLSGGEVPDEGDMVVVAYSPDEPEVYAALETELDRMHAQAADDEAPPDPKPFVISGGVLVGLALLVGLGGGIWSARGTPKPRPQYATSWGYGYPPPGSGPPPGYGYPQPPGYGPAQPGSTPPGYGAPGYGAPGYGYGAPGYGPSGYGAPATTPAGPGPQPDQGQPVQPPPDPPRGLTPPN